MDHFVHRCLSFLKEEEPKMTTVQTISQLQNKSLHERPPYEKIWAALLVLTIIEVSVGTEKFLSLVTKLIQVTILIV